MRHQRYRATRYFAALDGLRALAILLVIATHTADPVWRALRGPVGVTIFFVISGFLITTLLLREERDRGAIRPAQFYLRRAFRILPVYYLVLALYVLLVGVLRVQPGAADAWRTLPYYLLYQNDLVSSDWGLNMTWSLAIQEKFYLLWPLIFLIPAGLRRHRLGFTLALAVVLLSFDLAPGPWSYPAIFSPVIDGCLVALLLDDPVWFARSRPLVRSSVALGLLGLAVADVLLVESGDRSYVGYGVLVAALLPACLTGPRWIRRVLASPILTCVGTRSYALYLVHRLVKGVVDRQVPPGGSVSQQLLRYALIVAAGLAAAEVLRRTVELPMILLGRRLLARRLTGPTGGRHRAGRPPALSRVVSGRAGPAVP